MRKGDLVVHHSPPGEFSKLWLYSGIPKPEVPTISIATSWPWTGSMHGLVVDEGYGFYNNRYLQVITSLGHVGWIPSSWAEVIDEALCT